MFETQQQEEDQELSIELQATKDIKILKQIFHWVISHSGLWNSSMGRDFIYSIESLENGISVIDHIISPKEEEVWPSMDVFGEGRNFVMEPYEQGLVRQIERDNIVNAQPQVNMQRNCKY